MTELGHADKLKDVCDQINKQTCRIRVIHMVLFTLSCLQKQLQLPENRALSGLCQGMVEAWKLQGSNNAGILFVIEDVTYNICDQRFHEFEIRSKYPQIKVIRKTLTEIHDEGKLGAANELIM